MKLPRSSHTIAIVVAGVAFAGCSVASDQEIALPIAEVQRARALALLTEPPVNRLSREEYAAQSERTANAASDDVLRQQRDAYGRLGFFPRDFDPRSTARTTSALYGAYYSNTNKNITVIGSPTRSLLVHELTHALQDQHFDLSRYFDASHSSDEAIAQRGLIEGDAVLAAFRYEAWGTGYDPTVEAARTVIPATARELSEQTLDETTVPLVFVALPAFAYSYGATYVASLLQIPYGSWSYAGVDALLADHGPASTQEVLLAGGVPDPIVPAGLTALPAAAAGEYTVDMVDRIGEWYTYLLFRPITNHATLQALTARWDGDQLLLLRKKDGTSGIVWTSVWDDDASAAAVERLLLQLHTGSEVVVGGFHGSFAQDGESIWIEQRGNQVCLVKNLPEVMDTLAHVALSTRDERRLEILRVVASTPNVH
jgi:hypothetical protein